MSQRTTAGTPVRVPAVTAARIPSLTGLRWIAAFLVFGFHVQAEHVFRDPTAQHLAFAIFGQGATGVDFFFVLSGFVLTWSARPGTPARTVWRRRAAKVVPNHVVTWVIAVAGLVYFDPRSVSVVSSVLGLFLLQAWVPAESVYYAGNTPAWSLSCEMAFYFAFPLLLVLVNRLRDRRLWPAAIALVVVVLLIPALVLPLPTDTAYWLTYVFPLTRMVEFALGMLLARIVRAGRWPNIGLGWSMALCVAGYWLSAYLPGTFGYVAATVILISLLVGSAAVADVNGTWSPWRHRWCVRLGEISFAFYLLHQIVLRFADKAFHLSALPTAAAAGLTAGLLVVTVVAALLLFNTVEQPMMRLLRGRR